MKQGYDGGKNVMFDEEAQRQIRAMNERMRAQNPDKIQVDPSYEAEVRGTREREEAFKYRRQEVQHSALSDTRRYESFTQEAAKLETYQGYLQVLNGMTVAGVERVPTPEDWIRLRDRRRDMVDGARETHYASSHASAMLGWAEGKPDPLKLAIETAKGQLNEARAALDAAAIEVNRIWTQAPGSPELAQAQSALVDRQKVVSRFQASLRLIEKGN